MDKKDWIWVAIRVLGIYLLADALCAIPSLVSNSAVAWWNWAYLRHAHGTPVGDDVLSNTLLNVRRYAFESSLSGLASSFLRVVLLGGIGLYLVKSGRLVYRLVFPPQEDQVAEDHPASKGGQS